MKLAFLADGRSPIAINWIRWFVENGFSVHWISSRRAPPPLDGLASFRILPLSPELPGGWIPSRKPGFLHPAATWIRHWLMPIRLGKLAGSLRLMLSEIEPDLLHAMRIPQEGMTAALAREGTGLIQTLPLIVSVWGDDFTYHAHQSPMMNRLTRKTVEQADGLHADCQRDVRIAREWGLRIDTKTLVTPGNGGIRSNLFFKEESGKPCLEKFGLPAGVFFILNPRGIRNVSRTDTFFNSIPLIKAGLPRAHFIGLRMQGTDTGEKWVRKLNLHSCVTLLPALSQEDLADLYRLSRVTVSLTEHDGVPNVLLESMACGSFPICGDLESIREWITDGQNGLLVNPGDASAVAEAVIRACRDNGLRREAADINRRLIAERGDWNLVMPIVRDYYQAVAGRT